MNNSTETFEQFCERMSKVEHERILNVGRACYGHTRSIFNFEGQYVHLESRNYRNIDPSIRNVTPAMLMFVAAGDPKDWWDHTYLIYGKKRAEKIRKYYSSIASLTDGDCGLMEPLFSGLLPILL